LLSHLSWSPSPITHLPSPFNWPITHAPTTFTQVLIA
jgi:hypothetical protein